AEHERENLLLARIRDAGIDVKDGHFETMITFMMGPLAFGEDCGLKGFNIQNYDGRPALEGLVPNGDGGFRFVGDDGKETENLGRT
ncbi:hypothetical protein, partial [Streptomyces scabiei]|uniref:hypothetical protein n=1 Tax=Streptomyces scabiei TaxID=1930 RepID=UPI0038F73583